MHRFSIAAALIALLLQSGQAIAQSEAKTYFTLVELCASDDATPEAIQDFLDLRVDGNTKDKDENTPLLLCVKRGDAASSMFLIQNGADVNARNRDGLAALYYARKEKQKEIETALIRANAKEHPAWIFVDGRTIFECASDPKTRPGQLTPFIAAIREAGASVNARAKFGHTPLHAAAKYNENPEVLTLLIKAGADVNAKDKNAQTPLHNAARSNENPEVLTILIKAGADVNAKDEDGRTPLHHAAQSNKNPEVLTVLIKAGADLNAKDVNNWTPLHNAARYYGNPEVRTTLIKAGADVNTKDEDGRTPLHSAANVNMNSEVVRILIKAGADVNAKDNDGQTPLDRAGDWKPRNAEVLRAAGGKLGKDLP